MDERIMEDDDKAIERAARLGVRAELGHSALLPLQNGEPWYVEGPEEAEGGMWLVVFSDVSAAEEAPVTDFKLVQLSEIFRQQVEGDVGEGIALDPFTHPLLVPNGSLKTLLRVAKKHAEGAAARREQK